MAESPTPNGTILIVDDDRFLLDMYALKFSERGFKVDTAFSGQEVLDKVAAGTNPAVCLVDIVMPGMDGFTLIEEMKKRGICQNSALIILSNLGQKEDIDRSLALGADGYIVKASATPTEVVNRVAEIMGSKEKSLGS